MDQTVTAGEINSAYDELKRQVRLRASAERGYFNAQAALDAKRRQYLRGMEPNNLGKNAEQREAKLAELCATELQEVKDFERMAIADREHFELAKLEVDRVKQTLKLAAIEAGTSE